MIAYFVHDARKALDHIVIPEMDSMTEVNREVLELFISVEPRFDALPRKALNRLTPRHFGCVVATRDDQGDVCVEDACLWQERMQHYLGAM